MFANGKTRRLTVATLLVAFGLLLPGCGFGSSGNLIPDYTAQPEVIAVVGDFGSGRAAEGSVSKMVAAHHPSFVVTAGDNAYNKKGYDKLVGQYYPQKLVAATGNHDYMVGIDKFDGFFGIDQTARTYVYRAQSGVDFFILDSTAGLDSKTVRQGQLDWLTAKLKDSKANFKVVVLHHPPYSSSKHGSTPRYQWPFAELGADLVISGHDHTYERIVRSGGMYVVDGTGGAALYKCKKLVYGSLGCDDQHYGALFLYVNSYSMKAVFRGTQGQILDSFSFDK